MFRLNRNYVMIPFNLTGYLYNGIEDSMNMFRINPEVNHTLI